MPYTRPPVAADSAAELNWLFLDMNSFFASCEQLDDPELRGRPVAVCPVLAAGGNIIAASYPAKQAGVKNNMSAADALAVCPELRLVQARPKRYVQLHRAVMASIERHAPITKAYSIDEWALRLRGAERRPREAEALARRIKRQVRDDFAGHLPCSVGIATTRLLAKTACELHKPDGLTVLPTAAVPVALGQLKLRDLPGIGEGMAARLRAGGVRSPADLHALPRVRCRELWGSVEGAVFWSGLHGDDLPERVTRKRSVGHGHMLPPDLRNPASAHAIMVRLLSKAAMRIRNSGHLAHRLHARVSYVSDHRWTAEIALPAAHDTPTLVAHFNRLWRTRPDRPHDPPRKVGVHLAGLRPAAATTGHLFAQTERPKALSVAMDTINRRFGAHTLHLAAMTDVADYVMEDKIAFGRIPDEDIGM